MLAFSNFLWNIWSGNTLGLENKFAGSNALMYIWNCVNTEDKSRWKSSAKLHNKGREINLKEKREILCKVLEIKKEENMKLQEKREGKREDINII